VEKDQTSRGGPEGPAQSLVINDGNVHQRNRRADAGKAEGRSQGPQPFRETTWGGVKPRKLLAHNVRGLAAVGMHHGYLARGVAARARLRRGP